MRLSIAIVAAASIVALAADPYPPYVAVTNDAGRVLTLKRPSPTRTARVHSHGRTYEVDHWGNVRDLTPTNAPAYSLERQLARMREQRACLDERIAQLEFELGIDMVENGDFWRTNAFVPAGRFFYWNGHELEENKP